MASVTAQERAAWRRTRSQHGVITARQLRELGFTESAIRHRVAKGRLHTVHRGVYAVGTPELPLNGRRMAAVLACGPGALLSHCSAAALWAIRPCPPSLLEVSVPHPRHPRPTGVRVHRREGLTERDATLRDHVAVTSPALTLIDLGARLGPGPLEAAVNEADKLDLIDPEELRRALDERGGLRGVAALRRLLDRRTFVLTHSELERLFLPLARRAGLPSPSTQAWVNGFRVDFYWPALGLVVETDGLRYHRTASQQARDLERDNTHARAGLTPLRFSHGQIRFEPDHVVTTMREVAARLAAARAR